MFYVSEPNFDAFGAAHEEGEGELPPAKSPVKVSTIGRRLGEPCCGLKEQSGHVELRSTFIRTSGA